MIYDYMWHMIYGVSEWGSNSMTHNYPMIIYIYVCVCDIVSDYEMLCGIILPGFPIDQPALWQGGSTCFLCGWNDNDQIKWCYIISYRQMILYCNGFSL